MAWRGLHLSKESYLSLADGQIVIRQDGDNVRLPIEDVAWVVLDTPQASMTSSLVAACMDLGVAIIFTDATHMPSGVTLPFHRHHRQGGVARAQAEMGTPRKKRLWQMIVKAKITNQARALEVLGRDGSQALREMASFVNSGDTGNVEARAARDYWAKFFDDFRRDDDNDKRNKLLNYGYAVVRSGIARSLVASGLLPALGIHHASTTNAFNLADDLVEPFRPFVDVLAWRTVGEGRPSRDPLNIDDRRAMAGVLLMEAHIADETATLLTATERSAASLQRSIESNTADALELPALGP